MTAPVLRHDQGALVADTDDAFRAGHRGVLCVAPTAFGKGVVIAHWLLRCARAGKRVLFVVHLAEITFDVRERALAAGVPTVRVLSGTADEGDPTALVTIATWQTLVAREITLDGIDLIVIDEVHRAKAASYMGVIARHPRARLLGFTATAQRGDGSGLGDVGFTALVQGPQIAALVAAGHLAPIKVIAPDDYTEALAWDPVDAWLAHAGGAPGIVFASSIPDSRAIAAGLSARGVRAVHVDGDTPAPLRAAALAAFDSGELDALTCFRLFVEGVNVRRAAVAMLATAFSHDGPMLQGVGRVRRTHATKPHATLIDLRGNVWRRGFPDDERVYSLSGVGCRTALEPLPACRQCKVCLAWVKASVCEFCGASAKDGWKPARVKRAELKEQRAAKEAVRANRQASLDRSGDDWDFFAGLVAKQFAKGKSHTAAFLYKLAKGHPPKWRVAHALETLGLAAVEKNQ